MGARILGLLTLIAVASGACASPPELSLVDFAPPAEEVALDTWEQFVEFSSARHDCIPPLTVIAVPELANRATYGPGTHEIHLELPTTERRMCESLVHEFTHHVEFNCLDHEEVRDRFMTAGPSPSADWFAADEWQYIPSERFAEATVALVLGHDRVHQEMILTDEELAVAAAWWQRSELRPPSVARSD